MSRPAEYEVVTSTPDTLTIRDVGGSRCLTVTNDAEAVVVALHADGVLGTRTLLYYDSAGDLDELVHDGRGRFLGFAPGPGR